MKKFRDFLSRPAVTATLLALALVLLSGSTLGGARAALTIQSRNYNSHVELYDLGVALQESNDGSNWTTVATYAKPRNNNNVLMKNVLGADPKLIAGKKYPEMLRVYNMPKAGGTQAIDEYVRVAVYKYWLDPSGNKTPALDSEWIKLEFATGNGWSIDDSSSTEERTVLYYSPILAGGTASTPFLNSITIDKDTVKQMTRTESQVGNVTVITWTYDYNGYQFCLDVYVDAVQTHNVSDAKTSAWGVNK